jgi:hypothetical protein
MGTPLRVAIDTAAGGVLRGTKVGAVLVGVSSAVLTADQLDTELSYEGMKGIGSGLGSAGYIVIADGTDVVSVAAGVSHFLAVESCGQCTPCKQDGAEIARLLTNAASGDLKPSPSPSRHDWQPLPTGLDAVLPHSSKQSWAASLNAFPTQVASRFVPDATPVEIHLIAASSTSGDQGDARLCVHAQELTGRMTMRTVARRPSSDSRITAAEHRKTPPRADRALARTIHGRISQRADSRFRLWGWGHELTVADEMTVDARGWRRPKGRPSWSTRSRAGAQLRRRSSKRWGLVAPHPRRR